MKGKLGLASIGGIIRYPKGNLVVGYARDIRTQSSMTTKASVLFKGVKIVVNLSIKNLHIEGDSKFVIDSFNHNHWHGWSIKEILLDTKFLLTKLERKKMTHIYR